MTEKIRAQELLPHKDLILSGIEKIKEGLNILDLIARRVPTSTKSGKLVMKRLRQAVDSVNYSTATIRDIYDMIGVVITPSRRFFNFDVNGECIEVSEAEYIGSIDVEGEEEDDTSEQTIPL